MVDITKARAILEEQREELTQRLANLEFDLAEPIDPNSTEAAVQKEDDASLEGQANLVTRELGSVGRALDRIEAGTYGICVQCSADIAPERLAARPEAALCIDCARKA